MIVLLEFVGCEVVQAAVGPHCVVVVPPSFNDDSGLLAGSEPLQRQAFIAQRVYAFGVFEQGKAQLLEELGQNLMQRL